MVYNLYDVIIIGAGPSGCRTAEIVARKGYNVLILEEHPKIGLPIQCTGLVSKKIGKIPKQIILNKINKAKFCCKNSCFEIRSKEPMLLLNRKKYDIFLAERARKAGAKIKLSTRFLDFKDGMVYTNHGKFETKILVGADGPNSSVAKSAKLELPKNLLYALQVRVKSRFDPKNVELHFDSDIALGSFAWIVPESRRIARVGLMTTKNPNKYLDKFLKRFGRSRISDRTGDFIRYGLVKESVTDNVLLVGDAACQLKPFSSGGLIYNKICAEIAGDTIIKSLEQNNFSKEFLLESYDRKWKEKLAWPIYQGRFVKYIFSQVSNMPLVFSLARILNLGKFANFFDVDFLQK